MHAREFHVSEPRPSADARWGKPRSNLRATYLREFEDRACVACNTLHDCHFAAPNVNGVLQSFTVVRVDAQSDEAITAPDGTETTGKQLANELGITYRPTLVLLDGPAGDKAEIARIESMLYRYHFVGLLE